jgi:hypothetical protein
MNIKQVVVLILGFAATVPSATVLAAGPTNSILFVTQVPIPADYTTIGSTFGNQSATPESCGRGGDLYIRYPDGTTKNLTRAGGFGQWGSQNRAAKKRFSAWWWAPRAINSTTPR